MQVKAIDSIRDYYDGRDIILEPGDVLTVPDVWGAMACQNGWAEDVAGQVPTGEKSRDPVTVEPQNISSTQSG